ncbi:MAG: hypothetical protein LBD23_01250 [Oscillospiraceae bacterium]|jgi:hypothetical protein|nr:hypothetical protein [Oscillospiraceae bacterium]
MSGAVGDYVFRLIAFGYSHDYANYIVGYHLSIGMMGALDLQIKAMEAEINAQKAG